MHPSSYERGSMYMSLEHSPARHGGHTRKALSIQEFCDAHGISRGLFYKLKKQGKAPRIMEVNSRQLISDEAGADWRRAREADASASAE
jgi:predicted DNA-binding transcriptional regulator AlpA